MSGNYESIYGVGLLDDIHNYFPALLYEHGRFQNIQQVFSYIRSQMNQRFNLYNFGAEQYRVNHIPPVPVWLTQPVQNPPTNPFTEGQGVRNPLFTEGQGVLRTPFTQQDNRNRPSTPPPPTTSIAPSFRIVSLWEENDMDLANELLSLLSSTVTNTSNLGARSFRNTSSSRLNPNASPFFQNNSFLQPIPIRPSARVIEENSEILTGISGRNCAICQEIIESTANCRRLRTCQHVYHQSCIDTWFQESVFCPTCRSDIREFT